MCPDSDDNLDMRVAYLERIWDAAHMDMDAFASSAGMSLDDLSRTMAIDRQTILAWYANPTSIPEYVRVMLARAIGMI